MLEQLKPDAVLFVGDLGEGDLKLIKDLKTISIPSAVILGNHDRGIDHTGERLRTSLSLLDDLHCGWDLKNWTSPNIAVVGARPCSAGGGFYLSSEVQAVYGSVSLTESANRIAVAAKKAPVNKPLIILAHSGPVGLGSEASSPCGRDWRLPAIDWGDKDLALAIDQIRKYRIPDLVVFGHMHHQLKRGGGNRRTFVKDKWGTLYLNAACVPRRVKDNLGNMLSHLSWVEILDNQINHISHRWFRSDTSVAYQETLFIRDEHIQ